MKKNLLAFCAITLIVASGCNKKNLWSDFFDEVKSEEAQLRLDQSDYEVEVTEPLLSSLAMDYYTSGVVNYKLNGQTVASVDYGDGTHDSKAVKTINGSDEEFDLEKQCADSKSKNYYKVIIEPIVKTNDCDYIVAGVVKYFKCETKEWYATVNYGDGTCDGVAFKEWDGGSKEFSLDWDKK
jgi:hypothetical protein